jgi:FkbM family methyltransferase
MSILEVLPHGIRRLAKAAWHHPLLESSWQSRAGRLLRRAAGFPVTERIENVIRIEGVLVSTNKYGKTLRFFVRNRRDLVQAHHFSGEFYEAEELQIIQKYFKAGEIFVDIGANVGNHTVFAAKILNAKKVIPFELHPDAVDVLTANIALNCCETIDTSYLGYGVSLSPEKLLPQRAGYGNNLAGVRFERRGQNQGFPTISGDAALKDHWVDFIKIDIEGMEIEALESLEQTIKRCRPKIFIEVDNKNDDIFHSWCNRHKYSISESYQRYKWNVNYLLVTAN